MSEDLRENQRLIAEYCLMKALECNLAQGNQVHEKFITVTTQTELKLRIAREFMQHDLLSMIDFEDYAASEIVFQCLAILFAFFIHWKQFTFGPKTSFGEEGLTNMEDRCKAYGPRDHSISVFTPPATAEIIDLEPWLWAFFAVHIIDLFLIHMVLKDKNFNKIIDPTAWKKMNK